MELVGFVTISKYATTAMGTRNPDKFRGRTCSVMEFAADGGALVLAPDNTEMAAFDKQDIFRRFECSMFNHVVCPPQFNVIEQGLYVSKCLQRNGGYGPILMNMVIQASLFRGKFDDSLLWAKQ